MFAALAEGTLFRARPAAWQVTPLGLRRHWTDGTVCLSLPGGGLFCGRPCLAPTCLQQTALYYRTQSADYILAFGNGSGNALRGRDGLAALRTLLPAALLAAPAYDASSTNYGWRGRWRVAGGDALAGTVHWRRVACVLTRDVAGRTQLHLPILSALIQTSSPSYTAVLRLPAAEGQAHGAFSPSRLRHYAPSSDKWHAALPSLLATYSTSTYWRAAMAELEANAPYLPYHACSLPRRLLLARNSLSAPLSPFCFSGAAPGWPFKAAMQHARTRGAGVHICCGWLFSVLLFAYSAAQRSGTCLMV